MTGSITPLFYKDVPDVSESATNGNFRFELDAFSTVCIEAVYVIDFLKRGFHYVADHDLFLCGHNVEDAMLLGYDFYPNVIHEEDLPLLEDIHSAILRRLCGMKHDCGINYFSFTVRFKSESGNLMIHHKIKPIFIRGQIRFGVCLMASSAVPKTGFLRAYYGNKAYDEYSPDDGRWQRKTIKALSAREKTILRLAKQGKTGKEIAGEISISEPALRMVETSIYHKLNVHSMIQAIVFATNHRLLFTTEHYHKNLKLGLDTEPKEECRRQAMTTETLLRIQQKLDTGQSLNSIAKQENISEGTIRYRIKTGTLQRKPM